MTRNEFIAETAARLFATPEFVTERTAIDSASKLADALEARGFAPWQTPPAPALTDAVAVAWEDAALRVVGTAVAWERDPGSLDLTQAHIAAVRAYKEPAK